MSTLRDRIAWILEHRAPKHGRRPNVSKFSEMCGLARGHVAIILSRLEEDADRRIDHETLVAIAQGGGVSLEWLATGAGQPDQAHVPQASTTSGVGAEGRRALAARIALEGGVYDAAVYSVLSDRIHPEEADKSTLWWIHVIEGRANELVRGAASVGRSVRSVVPPSLPAESAVRPVAKDAPESERATPSRTGAMAKVKRRTDEAPPTAKPRR